MEQCEVGNAFLALAQSCQLETNINHSGAVGQTQKALYTFYGQICKRTERSLPLAQWLFIEMEIYRLAEAVTFPPLPPQHSSGSRSLWLRQNKAREAARQLQESTLPTSLLILMEPLRVHLSSGSKSFHCHHLPPKENQCCGPGSACASHSAPQGPGAGRRAGGVAETRPRLGEELGDRPGFFASHQWGISSVSVLFL